MSRIRKNIEYYRTPEEVETDIGSDNVSDAFANANKIIGNVTVYVATAVATPAGNDSTGKINDWDYPFLTHAAAIDHIKEYIIESDATVTISAGVGEFQIYDIIDINVGQGTGISFVGVPPIETEVTGITDRTINSNVPPYSFGTFDIELQLTDNDLDIALGDHLMITGVDETVTDASDDSWKTAAHDSAINGSWEVTQVASLASGKVTVQLDHFYTYWPPDGSASDRNVNFDHIIPPATSGLADGNGSVRILKTRIVQNINSSAIAVKGNKSAHIDNISIEHTNQAWTSGGAHGILVDDGAYSTIGGNISCRKCYRGINSHSGATVDFTSSSAANAIISTACVNGFMANIGASLYFSWASATGCYYGFNNQLNSTIIGSAAGVLRSWNCVTGFNFGGGGAPSIGNATGFFCLYGAVQSTSSFLAMANASFNWCNYGISVRWGSVSIISGLTVIWCEFIGVSAYYNSTCRYLSSTVSSNGWSDGINVGTFRNYQIDKESAEATIPGNLYFGTGGTFIEVS